MNDERRIRRRRRDVSHRRVGDETIVLDMHSSAYFVVNEAGTLLWGLLENTTSQAALVSAVVEAYSIEPEVAEVDVAAFLEVLRAHELLVEAPV